jgi:hypothetical protein
MQATKTRPTSTTTTIGHPIVASSDESTIPAAQRRARAIFRKWAMSLTSMPSDQARLARVRYWLAIWADASGQQLSF